MEKNEKFFEFLVNYELHKKYQNIYIPNQVKEGKLGFEMLFKKIGRNGKVNCNFKKKFKIIVLQYKVPSDLYINQTGALYPNIRRSVIADLGNNNVSTQNLIKWYSFDIYKNSRKSYYEQHNKLVNRANIKGWGVYYCAPVFETNFYEINKRIKSGKILSESVFINCGNLGKFKDSKIHRMHYGFKFNNINQNMNMKLHILKSDAQIKKEDSSFKSFDKSIFKNEKYIEMKEIIEELNNEYWKNNLEDVDCERDSSDVEISLQKFKLSEEDIINYYLKDIFKSCSFLLFKIN